jgi:hypothetical protein
MTDTKKSVFVLITVACLLVGGLGIVMFAATKTEYSGQTAASGPGNGPSPKEEAGQSVEKTVVLDWKWSW